MLWQICQPQKDAEFVTYPQLRLNDGVRGRRPMGVKTCFMLDSGVQSLIDGWSNYYCVLGRAAPESSGAPKGTCAGDACARAWCCPLEAVPCMGVFRARKKMSFCRGRPVLQSAPQIFLYHWFSCQFTDRVKRMTCESNHCWRKF